MMITVFALLILLAMIVGIIKLFGLMLTAAFHLFPFLFGLFLTVAVIAIAWYVFSWIGIISAAVLITVGCAGKAA